MNDADRADYNRRAKAVRLAAILREAGIEVGTPLEQISDAEWQLANRIDLLRRHPAASDREVANLRPPSAATRALAAARLAIPPKPPRPAAPASWMVD